MLLQRFHFRDAAVPLLLFAGAISSWYGGPGPALLAVILSVIGFDYFFVTPLYSLYVSASELPYFFIFVAFASLVSWFSMIRRRAEEDLRHTRDELKVLNQELANEVLVVADGEQALDYLYYRGKFMRRPRENPALRFGTVVPA